MNQNKTEIALQKIDEIIALLGDSDNPLDQLILMSSLTVKGSIFNYGMAMLLREALKEVSEQAIKLMEAQRQDKTFWVEDALEKLKEAGWQPPTEPPQT